MYNRNSAGNQKQNQVKKAVALSYESEKDTAPVIAASGKGFIATKILEIAKDHNIPVHRDVALTEILSVLEVDQHIPIEVYSVVAEIFQCIYEKERKQTLVKSVAR